ncbi:DUF4258 domain-containing protein [Anaerovibrio sp. JC8]|uniref:DUF4258 domain-containing protein n=1 Tax=Anaerovibrio sp. JC8 TaxID=1240085 RepID=UPI000A10DC3F|nr:DUF4258 domain-containing protein [Anaerovibrio sp. JC8]
MVIEELRNAFLAGTPIEYKVHCQKRMLERDISRKDIANCIMNGEIIEDYPLAGENKSDKSFPACLILGINVSEDTVLHVVVGYNGHKIIIISAYHPDKDHWEDDYKTRKVK